MTEPRAAPGTWSAELAALGQLARLRLRAGARSRLRRLATPGGAVALVAIVVAVWFVVGALDGRAAAAGAATLASGPPRTTTLSLGLLAGCLLTVLTTAGAPLRFSAAEMNVLFSAPLRRPALVLYRCLSYLVGAALSAALLAVLLPGAGARGRLFLATLLCLAFVQLASAVVSSVLTRLSGRPRTALLLRTGLVALLLVVAAALAALATGRWAVASPLDAAAARATLAPFSLFAGLYTETSALGLLARLALAALVLGLLIVALVRLDAGLHEEVAAASAAAERRWHRLRDGGTLWRRELGELRSRRPPRRPSGIAPLAWSQTLRAWRTATPTLGALFALAPLGGAALGAFATRSNAGAVAGMLAFAFLFVLPRSLAFDLRGTPRGIESLRTLPLPPWRICVGQIATPVGLAIALGWTVLLSALLFVEASHRPALVALGIALVPLTALHYALENLLYLLAPTRLVPVGRVDFDFLGRTLLDFVAKLLALGLAIAVACAVGLGTLLALPDGGRPAVALAVALATLALAAQAVLATALLARAFDRLDPRRLPLD